jgi:hypothetical protein
MLTTSDLVYVARTAESLERGIADFGERFDGNYYSWTCPTCQAVPNVQYAWRHTAEGAASDHIVECPGQPIAPHLHVRDNVHYPPHGTADPATAPACYAIHHSNTSLIDPIDPANLIAVELYDTEQPHINGVLLEEWDGQLDESTWAWLSAQGYDADNPRLWVNIVPADAWTPNNRPVNYRFAARR